MENVSKAVIMAGSVLIAISLISLAIYAYSYFRNYANTSEQLLSVSQVESFNRYYESFTEGTDTIRGIDALNIYNKAQEDGISCDSLGSWYSSSADLETLATHFLETCNYSIGYDSFGQVSSISFN